VATRRGRESEGESEGERERESKTQKEREMREMTSDSERGYPCWGTARQNKVVTVCV